MPDLAMAASEPLRFHEVCGKDVALSRCRNQAHRLFIITHALMEVLDGDPGSPGTEVAFSHRPVQVEEMVPLFFGQNMTNLQGWGPFPLTVTLGFTKYDPSTLSCVPEILKLEQLPGYWVSKYTINLPYRFKFFHDSAGQIHIHWIDGFFRHWTRTGPRVEETNMSLWAVLSIPDKHSVVFDHASMPRRAPNNAVSVSSQHRAAVAHSLPSSSSQRASTPHQSEGASSSPQCIICYNSKADTAMSPCGHMYTCYGCAIDIWQGRGQGSCPSCRKQINSVLRVYRD